MNIIIISNSFIVKESITSIFKRIYDDIKLLVINSIDELKDSSMYDILLIHIGNNNFEDLNKAIKLKSEFNKTIILDSYKNPKTLNLCIDGNLDGYVTDFENEYEIKYVLNKIINGNRFYDSNVVEKIIRNKNINIENSILTEREEEVINEVIKGLTNKDIANMLDITEFTVKKHISNVLNKLNLKNRKDIIVKLSDKKIKKV